MTFTFCEKYFGSDFLNKLQCVLPQIKLRIRDDIAINSRRCSFEDFGKFVITDNLAVPLFLANNIKGNIIDCKPLICIGMLEHLLAIKEEDTSTICAFEASILEKVASKHISLEEVETFLEACKLRNASNNEWGMLLAYSLRYGNIRVGQALASRVIGNLYYLACMHTDVFTEILFDFMYMFMASMRIYCDPNTSLITVDEDEGTINNLEKGKDYLDFKSYQMKNPRKNVIKLTNGRGLALSTLTLFVLHIIKDTPNNKTLYKEGLIEYAQENFFSALGEDITGNIIRGKNVSVSDVRKSLCGYNIFKPSRCYTINDESVQREVYEEEFLFRKAYGVSYNKGLTNFGTRDISMHYITPDILVSACSVFYTLCAKNEASLKADINLLQHAKKELEKRTNRITVLERSLSSIESKNKEVLDDITEDYEKKIKDLQYQLEQKNQIISQLSEKNEILTSRMSSFFCDSDFEEDEDLVVTEVTQEERVNYLNGFSFLLVGGREGLAQKLEDCGWTSITQVSSVSNSVLSADAFSRPNFDFIVINTKFVSHNLVRCVESRYSDLTDRVIYFNGTNVELLTRITIDFIKNYMEV